MKKRRKDSLGDYLVAAEMSEEAGYNMVGDGIINNAPPKDAGEQKPSILEKLNEAQCAENMQQAERSRAADQEREV
jgi:hypothetical protein